MNSLVGKKVLLFAPKFFNYETIIKTGIEDKGGIVHLYDERNNATTFRKIIIRKCKFLLTLSINKYYSNIAFNESSFNPDYILFISPETINKKSLMKLRNTFSKAFFILYMYDSIENKNSKNIYSLFDKCFSFDQNDCKKYLFNFRPLFFSPEFDKVIDEYKDFKYDMAFIGTIHSDRARILNKIREICEQNGLRFYYYLFVPGKILLKIRSFFSKDIRSLAKYMHVEAIDKKKVSDILEKTKYVIDINHPKQVGLTMRTIEMLGLRKKILTTNVYISGYDFYKPSNQIIINRKKIAVDIASITNHFEIVDDQIIRKYCLSNWIEEVLGLEFYR